MGAFTKWRFAACLLMLAALPAAAVTQVTGTTPAGAAYRIAAPDGWAPGDGLVLIQHGFTFDAVTDPTLGPLRDRMLADGYAVAASGYRQRGWALFTARDDNAELLDVFRARFGTPGHLVAAGGSMGGLVALKLAEDPRFRDQTEGVLALCPAADGMASWDTAFDLRLAYDAICESADGGDLPRGSEPTPWALDLDQLPANVDAPEDSDALLVSAAGIARCTGLGIPASLRTGGMRDRLARLMQIAQTRDEEALLQQLAYAVVGLSELVRAPDKLAGRVPFFNRAIVDAGVTSDLEYGAGIDVDIRRVERDDFTRLDFHRHSSLDGSASARIVSVHTFGDAVVPLWHQKSVAARYPGRALIGVARNDTPVHCAFTHQEIEAGWSTLLDWIASDSATPAVSALRTNCRSTVAGGCRFDLDSDALVRNSSHARRSSLTDVLAPLGRTVGGLWTSPQFPSQGVMIEELDTPLGSVPNGEQRYTVSWYTWAPAGAADPGPRWMVGTGRSYESTLFVDDLVEVAGGRFGALLDPGALRVNAWGSLVFALDDRPGVLRYRGPAGWGSGERRLDHTVKSGLGVSADLPYEPPSRLDFGASGTYYDPAHPGQGWVLDQHEFGGQVASLLVWYTHDPAGKPSWMYGVDSNAADGLGFAMTRAVQGGTFETGVAPVFPYHQPWGTVSLARDACRITAVTWQSNVAGYGNGTTPVVRLTQPWQRFDPAGCRR